MKQFIITIVGKGGTRSHLSTYVRKSEEEMFVFNCSFDVIDGLVDVKFLEYIEVLLKLGYQLVSEGKL